MAKMYSDEDSKNVTDFIRSRTGTGLIVGVVIVTVVFGVVSLFTGLL